jgi:hypothetical protein
MLNLKMFLLVNSVEFTIIGLPRLCRQKTGPDVVPEVSRLVAVPYYIAGWPYDPISATSEPVVYSPSKTCICIVVSIVEPSSGNTPP